MKSSSPASSQAHSTAASATRDPAAELAEYFDELAAALARWDELDVEQKERVMRAFTESFLPALPEELLTEIGDESRDWRGGA